jgi:hypothetical protein
VKVHLDAFDQTNQFQILLVATVVLGCALANAANAMGQDVVPPSTPAAITPPAGNSAYVVGHAIGTQGYTCLPTSIGASTASWTVNSRPEATLFFSFFGRNKQIMTHFLSPDTNPNKNAPTPLPFGSATWQSSFDSSKVWGQKTGSIPAGSDGSCPDQGAIACLLLQSIGSEEGPAGGRFLTETTYIQRLNTKGGSAPATGCSVVGDVGKQILVPYTADYYLYKLGSGTDTAHKKP